MLIVQRQPAEPFWKPVMGAQVQFAPIDRPMVRRARRAVAKEMEAAGTTVPIAVLAEDASVADLLEAMGDAFSHALLMEGVLDWKDVCLMEDGEAEGEGEMLPCTPENKMLVFSDEPTFRAFDLVYVMPYASRVREKNGSSPSPNGTGAGAMPAGNIAGSRAKRTGKGAVKGVRTGSTSRGAKKVTASGK